MDQEDKFGIEQTKDIIAFAQAVVTELQDHLEDDGKIDGSEIAQTLLKSVPEGISAMAGIGEIKDEMNNLTENERAELWDRTYPILVQLAEIFMPDLELEK